MILIVEGIFALNPTLTSGVDMVKIFVDTPMDVSALRRLERDVRERGRQWGTGAAYYLNTVRPMYIAHIEPTKKAADLVIENSNSEDIVRAISQVEYKITYPKQCAFTMQVLSGFIAALGIAAVATAFVALNAATLGAAGLALGAVGAVAIGLGVAGLFKYKPEPTMAPSVMPTERFALS